MEFKSLLGPEDPDKDGKRNTDPTQNAARNNGSFPKLPGGSVPAPRTSVLWAVIGLLAATFVGAASLGYEQLQADRRLLPDFAQASDVEAVGNRVDSLDGRLTTLVGRVATSDVVEGLATRISGIERTVARGLEATRADIAEIREANADIEWRIQSSVEERTSSIRERLADLESEEQARRAELVALEDKIEMLGLDLAGEIDRVRQDEAVVNAGFEGRVAGAERRLDIVAYAVEKDRVDFEMYQDLDEEVSPGIVLHLSDVDRRYQRVDGWLWLVPEARFLRIENQPIQESLVFYTHQDDRPHELVFTRVTETAAVGYMRIPSESLVESARGAWQTPSVAVAAND